MDVLSEAQRSCINLSKTEPCVRKALQLLQSLREQVQSQPSYPAGGGSLGGSSGRPLVGCGSGDSATNKDSETAQEDLSVQGRGTGHMKAFSDQGKVRGREGDVDWNAVIKGAVDLIIRMEDDRQKTLHNLSEEKERVHCLGQKYDMECKRRLDLLESAVQAEHEHSMDDIRELDKSLEKEKKELSEVLCDLSIIDAKHTKLKNEEVELVHSSSLLREKVTDERRKIEQIEMLQIETLQKVDGAKKNLKSMEKELYVYRKKVDAENKVKESKRDAVRSKLNRAREELNTTEEVNETLQTKIHRLEDDIKETAKKIKEYEAAAAEKMLEFTDIHSEVCALQEEYDKLAEKNLEAESRNMSLNLQWQKEREAIEEVNARHRAALEEAQHSLQELKDRREELERDIDRIREETSQCKKEQEDDLKSVERGNGQLARLERQLEVSDKEFTRLRHLNHALSQRFEETKTQTESEKYKLKMSVENIGRKIKETDSSRKKLEAQEKIAREQLQSLEHQLESLKDELRTVTETSSTTEKAMDQEVAELESHYSKQDHTVSHLMGEIATVEEDYASTQLKMGEEVEELERTAAKLKTDLEEKTETCETLTAKEETLLKAIKELNKSVLSAQKMKQEIQEENEELELTVQELSERARREDDEESSLEEELKNIVEFREDARNRFEHYSEEREQYLKELKRNLSLCLARTASLKKDYESLQGEYLALKSSTLGELEQLEDTEVAARDLSQLEFTQVQLSSHLKNHLEYRSSMYTNKLLACQMVAKANHDTFCHLHSELRQEMESQKR